jgi:Caspase domain
MRILGTIAGLTAAVFCAVSIQAGESAHRRALLIGINDYTASKLAGQPMLGPPPDRDWPNLTGAVNDVHTLASMLKQLYGFRDDEIFILTDQDATRDAILAAIDDRLVKRAGKGDVVFFYFGGHGSQVRNSRSEEPDKLDESIVPADSRRGAKDIRDKELRKRFNAILDADARLTIVLDNCHSGSGVRGLPTGSVPRGVRPDLRDVADRAYAGPAPEQRGALVLTASHEFDEAWETRDEHNEFHGAFSWALIRSLCVAPQGEPAIDTFLRAEARMCAETPYQDPVIAGDADARLAPFLGERTDQRDERTVIAVDEVLADGTLILQGGWVNGLAEGTELRIADDHSAARFRIIALDDVVRSRARSEGQRNPAITSGTLLEVIAWSAPRGRPLRVHVPAVPSSIRALARLARAFKAAAAEADVHWVADPTVSTATRLLRHSRNGWEFVGPRGERELIGSDAAAVAAVAKLPSGSCLFVQIPAPASFIDGLSNEGIVISEAEDDADYILTGRYSGRRLSYAWLRPHVKKSDRRMTGLPPRTTWVSEKTGGGKEMSIARVLCDAAARLRRIHAWSALETPPRMGFQYRLRLRRTRNDKLVESDALIGEENYQLVLRAGLPRLPRQVAPRYVYAFAVDSYGKSVLLYPVTTGSADNRFPSDENHPTLEIPIGKPFEVAPPYGTDTYYLLSTADPLPNPWILEWDGVRTRLPETLTPLEEVLLSMQSGLRAGTFMTHSPWSIERLVLESIAPPARHASAEISGR